MAQTLYDAGSTSVTKKEGELLEQFCSLIKDFNPTFVAAFFFTRRLYNENYGSLDSISISSNAIGRVAFAYQNYAKQFISFGIEHNNIASIVHGQALLFFIAERIILNAMPVNTRRVAKNQVMLNRFYKIYPSDMQAKKIGLTIFESLEKNVQVAENNLENVRTNAASIMAGLMVFVYKKLNQCDEVFENFSGEKNSFVSNIFAKNYIFYDEENTNRLKKAFDFVTSEDLQVKEAFREWMRYLVEPEYHKGSSDKQKDFFDKACEKLQDYTRNSVISMWRLWSLAQKNRDIQYNEQRDCQAIITAADLKLGVLFSYSLSQQTTESQEHKNSTNVDQPKGLQQAKV